MTVAEIDAMFDGYLRRREQLEDLFIINCALPTYRGAYGRKAPTYKKLTAYRQNNQITGSIDTETADYWRSFFMKERTKNVKKLRTQK
nr:MAG TPA: hypothetical protein [Caudoviricetes sp.]